MKSKKSTKEKSKSIAIVENPPMELFSFSVDKEQFVRDNLELFVSIKRIAEEEGYELSDDDIRFLQREILSKYNMMMSMANYGMIISNMLNVAFKRL